MALLWGILLLLATNVLAQEPDGCVETCVRRNPLFQYPACGQLGENLTGPRCAEVYNECLQNCRLVLRDNAGYFPSPLQTDDVWKQMQVCESSLTDIPLVTAPGDQVIDRRLSGYCECLNGKLLVASCGHREVSCNQACSGQRSF